MPLIKLYYRLAMLEGFVWEGWCRFVLTKKERMVSVNDLRKLFCRIFVYVNYLH